MPTPDPRARPGPVDAGSPRTRTLDVEELVGLLIADVRGLFVQDPEPDPGSRPRSRSPWERSRASAYPDHCKSRMAKSLELDLGPNEDEARAHLPPPTLDRGFLRGRSREAPRENVAKYDAPLPFV